MCVHISLSIYIYIYIYNAAGMLVTLCGQLSSYDFGQEIVGRAS